MPNPHRRVLLASLILLLSGPLFIGSFVLPPRALAATSGDAYAMYDAVSGIWTLGTSRVEKQLRLNAGTFLMTRLYNKLTARELLQGGKTGVEFQITANGTSYNGSLGGWVLDSQNATIGPQGSLEQRIALRNTLLTITLHYIIWPGTGVIEQWIEYTNNTAQGYIVSDPEILDTNVMADDIGAGTTQFHYFSGGENTEDALRPLSDAISSTWTRTLASEHYGSNDYLQEIVYRSTTHNDGVLLGWSYTATWFGAFNGQGRIQIDASGANGTTLAAGQTYTMPLTHIMVFKGDLDDAGNDLKDFQYQYKWDLTNDAWVGTVKPYFIGFNPAIFANDTTFAATQYYRYVGADIWHVDGGWQNNAGDWDNGSANTTIMSELYRFAERSGMGLMVWLPINIAESHSQILSQNPNWGTTSTEPTCIAGTPLDLSNSDAVAWMEAKLQNETLDFGPKWIWRQDFGGGSWDGAGVNQIIAHNNFFALMRNFKAQNPEAAVNVNQCGGRQMSLETVRYGDIIQTTDGGPGHYSVYTPSYLYPPDKLWGSQLDVDSDYPNADWSTSYADLIGGLATAWQWDGSGVPTTAQLENFRKVADIYHFMQSVGLAGRWVKVYHPDRVDNDDKSYYVQRMSRDNTKGVIVPLHSKYDPNYVRVYPKGLIPTLSYTLRIGTFQTTNTGQYWMDNGIGQFNWGGNLAWLNVTNFPGAQTDTVAPGGPTNVTKRAAVYQGKPGVELTWAAASDNNWVSYYEVLKNGVPLTKSAKARFAFDPSGSLSDSYQVRAVDGDSNSSPLVLAVSGGEVFNAAASFSSTQGSGQWSYKQTNDLISYTDLAWDGGDNRWEGVAGYPILAQTWDHPDTSAKSARVWTAPRSGTVRITGSARKADGGIGGNGVNLKMLQATTQVWPAGSSWQYLGPTDTTGLSFDVVVPVSAGENVYFVLDGNGSAAYDQTNWSVTVTYEQ